MEFRGHVKHPHYFFGWSISRRIAIHFVIHGGHCLAPILGRQTNLSLQRPRRRTARKLKSKNFLKILARTIKTAARKILLLRSGNL
jgi:hypothetical protein